MRSESPVPVNEALDDYNARKDKLNEDWQASSPVNQFEAQRREEVQRIELARQPVGVNWLATARIVWQLTG